MFLQLLGRQKKIEEDEDKGANAVLSPLLLQMLHVLLQVHLWLQLRLRLHLIWLLLLQLLERHKKMQEAEDSGANEVLSPLLLLLLIVLLQLQLRLQRRLRIRLHLLLLLFLQLLGRHN